MKGALTGGLVEWIGYPVDAYDYLVAVVLEHSVQWDWIGFIIGYGFHRSKN